MTYVPNTDQDTKRMLDSLRIGSKAELFDMIPDSISLKDTSLDLPGPLSEMELLRHSTEIGKSNANLSDHVSFLGAGVYDHFIPATVPAIIGRSEFYTAYTPYQPELSQGNLQSIFEFQTLICELTGMEVANASMYDGATAVAESAIMASAITGRSQWIVPKSVHPSYRETLRTYAWASDHQMVETSMDGITTDLEEIRTHLSENTACVIIQSPNFFGAIEQLAKISKDAHAKGALFIVCFNPISLGLLKPPGEYDADICVGEGQPLGVPASFGGPLLGLFACKKEHVRHMPGRLVGATVDREGRRGYTLTLQTREQHIRRERATSNICTNEALCALSAAAYLSTLGKSGLREVSNLCLQKAHYAADEIAKIPGFKVPSRSQFFHEFVIKCPVPVSEINKRLMEKGIIGGLALERFYPEMAGHMLICVTEKRTKDEIDALIGGLA